LREPDRPLRCANWRRWFKEVKFCYLALLNTL
jgi:hypothetical protein